MNTTGELPVSVFSIPFFDQAGYGIALKTFSIVDRDQAAALGAAMLVILVFQEGIQAHFLDLVQVGNHTHAVVLPVPFVHALDARAGILFTFITKTSLAGWALIEAGTFFKEIRAGSIAGPAAGTLGAV